MKSMEKKNICLIFGGKSAEHEVSIVTGLQASGWVDPAKYNLWLVYLNDQNKAYLCSSSNGNYRQAIETALLKKQYVQFSFGGIIIKNGFFNKYVSIDCALLATHGGSGENGVLQGMLEFFDIAYTGSGILGSSLGMDKSVMKQIFVNNNLLVLPYISFSLDDYEFDGKGIKAKIEKTVKYPVFVKPARGGSSLGISRVEKESGLDKAIKEASGYDYKIIIEQELKEAIDINCAVMGGDIISVSLCEQPLKEDEFLTFEEKYLKGGKTKGMAGLSRIVPAPIPDKVSREIQEMAKIIYKTLDCWGSARIDFLYQKKSGKVYPCEINTIPGSLSYYLWQASGIDVREMVDRLIDLAIEKKNKNSQINFSYRSQILDQK